MLATARTLTLHGIYSRRVSVEVDVHRGLPSFTVVGLPDVAVRECRERVSAALTNNGFEFPLRRVVVNLAPASLRKAGSGMDLAIAAALLSASDQLAWEGLDSVPILGELALDGTVRPVNGVLQMTEAAREEGAETIVVPAANASEAALVEGIEILPLHSIGELPKLSADWRPIPPEPLDLQEEPPLHAPDLADLRGQPQPRRALEVAAGGGHSLLMIGPPGAGKSMAAARLPSILPEPSRAEALEVARISSACGRLTSPRHAARPFRAPHHTISPAGLVGSGYPPRAGEVTLAHRGVLYLDEINELRRESFVAMRAHLTAGKVEHRRGLMTLMFPARFLLVVGASSCPCAYGEESPRCKCDPAVIPRYRRRLDETLGDAIAIRCRVSAPRPEEIAGVPGETSSEVRRRVSAARERQERRLGAGRCNAEMAGEEIWGLPVAPEATSQISELLGGDSNVGGVLRLAQTLADLEAADSIQRDHIEEACALQTGVGE